MRGATEGRRARAARLSRRHVALRSRLGFVLDSIDDILLLPVASPTSALILVECSPII